MLGFLNTSFCIMLGEAIALCNARACRRFIARRIGSASAVASVEFDGCTQNIRFVLDIVCCLRRPGAVLRWSSTMSAYPGITVRSYPAFRPARLYRVLVSRDALYFIRLKGLISVSDAGSESPFALPQHVAFAALIRIFARSSLAKSLAEIERSDPEELLYSSHKHFKLTAADFISSTLDPPSLFSAHGPSYARWKIVAQGHKNTYQVEDAESLSTALQNLPNLLGAKLTVTFKSGN
jgi:hypothetical protein